MHTLTLSHSHTFLFSRYASSGIQMLPRITYNGDLQLIFVTLKFMNPFSALA